MKPPGSNALKLAGLTTNNWLQDPIYVAFQPQEASGLSNHQDVELIGSRYDGLRALSHSKRLSLEDSSKEQKTWICLSECLCKCFSRR